MAQELETLGAKVVAVSVDPVAALAAFRTRQGYTFAFLSDEERRLSTYYGVLEGTSCRRADLLLDPDGVVRHVALDISLSQHGKDMVEALRKARR
ncbi:MAG: redoxin domain-containing protein [Dehalococcoidia bacterium]|nr:redoxin domain-containing protein [Planctomycetota bacterium]MCB9492420.1 redoxin domain-containing protein [Dehalococcoidia bacterium]